MQRAAEAARVGSLRHRGSPPRLVMILRAHLPRWNSRWLCALLLAVITTTGGGSAEERGPPPIGVASDPLKPFADLLLRNSGPAGSGRAWMPGDAIVVPVTHSTINEAIQFARSPDVRPSPLLAHAQHQRETPVTLERILPPPFRHGLVWCSEESHAGFVEQTGRALASEPGRMKAGGGRQEGDSGPGDCTRRC